MMNLYAAVVIFSTILIVQTANAQHEGNED